jgi:type VI secretion system protein ImpC
MHILLMANFSGGSPAGDLARRPLRRVDLDSFEAALGALAPRLDLDGEALSFERLEDFHPDGLFARLPRFSDLRELRRRLLDPATFAATADALEQNEPRAGEDDGRTLERLLGARQQERPAVSGFIEQIVAPHIVPDISARQSRLVAAVDGAAGQHMRAVLHHPPFQRLEAAWRAVHRLVTTLEVEELALFLLDVARAELSGDSLRRRLADGAPDGRPWSLLALDETFGPGDLDLLAELGGTASAAGASLVAAAHPRLLGCVSFAETPDPGDWRVPPEEAARWQAVRAGEAARWLGLAAPRWLLRLPYGAKTDPIEAFPFDELDQRAHERYLWGNPAFACAQLFATGDAEIEDLPCHIYREGGEAHLQACAEVFLGQRAVDATLARGIMPLESARDRGVVRMVRLQSIADPPGALSPRG